MMHSNINLWKLVQSYLKRNKILIIIWVSLPVLSVMGGFSSFIPLADDPAQLTDFVNENVNNPLITAILGKILIPSLAGIVSWKTKGQALIMLSVLTIFFVVKSIRKEEETGQTDLVYSNVVGRTAITKAVLIVTFLVNLIICSIIFFIFIKYGSEAGGSFLTASTLFLASLFFAGIAAALSQIYNSASSAMAVSYMLMSALLIISFAANSFHAGVAFNMISPFSWYYIFQPFRENNYWFLAVAVALISVLVMLTFYLFSKRDIGSGLVEVKPGRADAVANFDNLFFLNLRTQGNSFLGWAMGIILFSSGLGAASNTFKSYSTESGASSFMAQFGNTQNAFIEMVLFIMLLIVAAYTVLATLALYSQENQRIPDFLIGNRVSRWSFIVNNMVYSVIGSAIIMLLAALAVGVTSGSISGNLSGDTGYSLLSAIKKLPVLFLLQGIILFLYSILPTISNSLGWGLYGVCILAVMLFEGNIIGKDLFKATPFAYAHPMVLGVSTSSLIVILVLAILLNIGGLAVFKRRDIL